MSPQVALLFLLASSVAAERAFDTRECPEQVGKSPFDGQKNSGLWYVIAQARSGGSPSKCIKVTLQPSEDTLDMTIEAVGPDGQNLTLHGLGIGWIGKDKVLSSPEHRMVFKAANSEKWSEVYHHNVLATDYDTYAIVLACRTVFKPETKQFGRQMTTSIMSRTPTLPEEKLKILKSVAVGQNIDPSSLETIDHSNC